MKRPYTVKKAAKKLGVTPKYVYRLIHAGKLRAFQHERALRVPREAVAEYRLRGEEKVQVNVPQPLPAPRLPRRVLPVRDGQSLGTDRYVD